MPRNQSNFSSPISNSHRNRLCRSEEEEGGGGEKMADDPSAADRNVEIWKIKKLIKSLEAARG